jgi:uncharacterized Zn finger protein (UPF0148 family)
MTTKQQHTENSAILADVIHCERCGSPMVLYQTNYVCPNQDHETHCPTASVNAERLAHQLISTLVDRVMTPKNLSQIIENIQRDAAGKIITQQDKLDETESAIEKLNRDKADLLTEVEYGTVTYSQVADQLESIEGTRAGLAYESAVSREEIDKMEFVSDPQAIQSVALNVEIYTEFAEPILAKELVHTFIADIRIAATSCVVTYTHPMLGANKDELITSESFPLP